MINQLTIPQILKLALDAGFPDVVAVTMTAIAKRESDGVPSAFNGNSSTGDESYGLWQINMIGALGDARMKQFGLKDKAEPYSTRPSTRARPTSRGGTTTRIWKRRGTSTKSATKSATRNGLPACATCRARACCIVAQLPVIIGFHDQLENKASRNRLIDCDRRRIHSRSEQLQLLGESAYRDLRNWASLRQATQRHGRRCSAAGYRPTECHGSKVSPSRSTPRFQRATGTRSVNSPELTRRPFRPSRLCVCASDCERSAGPSRRSRQNISPRTDVGAPRKTKLSYYDIFPPKIGVWYSCASI